MNNNKKATITSLIEGVLLPLMTMLGIAETTQNYVIGVIAGMITIILWYYNEKYNSNLVSGDCEDEGQCSTTETSDEGA